MIKCLIFLAGIQVQNIDYKNQKIADAELSKLYKNHEIFCFDANSMPPKKAQDYIEAEAKKNKDKSPTGG